MCLFTYIQYRPCTYIHTYTQYIPCACIYKHNTFHVLSNKHSCNTDYVPTYIKINTNHVLTYKHTHNIDNVPRYTYTNNEWHVPTYKSTYTTVHVLYKTIQYRQCVYIHTYNQYIPMFIFSVSFNKKTLLVHSYITLKYLKPTNIVLGNNRRTLYWKTHSICINTI